MTEISMGDLAKFVSSTPFSPTFCEDAQKFIDLMESLPPRKVPLTERMAILISGSWRNLTRPIRYRVGDWLEDAAWKVRRG